MFRLIVIPAWRTFCWISCARSGISKPFQPASWTRNPSSWPAAASSSFALRTSCWRWATSFAVEGKTGANGLSLPKSDFVSSRPSTRSRRLTSSAIAWRVRLSLNCSVELLRWTWRWAEALSSIVRMSGSVSSALPPATENCTSMSTSLPSRPKTSDCSFE